MNKAIFIDKDGTLINDVPYNVNPVLISISKYVTDGLKLLQQHQFLFIIISNQPGVALGHFKEKDLEAVNKKINELLAEENIFIDAYYYCPHHPGGIEAGYSFHCNCRKPAPGMLLQAAFDFNIDLTQSWMTGDILNDVEAGNAAGCHTILIDNGSETEWRRTEKRKPLYTVKHFKEAAEKILAHEVTCQHNSYYHAGLE